MKAVNPLISVVALKSDGMKRFHAQRSLKNSVRKNSEEIFL